MTAVRQRAARDERAVSAYVERLGDTLTDAGMPRLASRVFAQLLADDDGRMTAAELTESLDVSPAAVSGAVRYLTQTYMIGKERERGSRRDVYVVQADAWHGAMLSRDRMLAQIETSLRVGCARRRWPRHRRPAGACSSRSRSSSSSPTGSASSRRSGPPARPRSPAAGPPTPDPCAHRREATICRLAPSRGHGCRDPGSRHTPSVT